jgi:hypothetical protein
VAALPDADFTGHLTNLLAVGGAQEHRNGRMPEEPAEWKRAGLQHSGLQISGLQAKGSCPAHPAKRL